MNTQTKYRYFKIYRSLLLQKQFRGTNLKRQPLYLGNEKTLVTRNNEPVTNNVITIINDSEIKWLLMMLIIASKQYVA